MFGKSRKLTASIYNFLLHGDAPADSDVKKKMTFKKQLKFIGLSPIQFSESILRAIDEQTAK